MGHNEIPRVGPQNTKMHNLYYTRNQPEESVFDVEFINFCIEHVNK